MHFSEIRKYSEILSNVPDDIDAIFIRRQIEGFELSGAENLETINKLENGDKIIGQFGEFRGTNSAEITEGGRLANLAQNPEDKDFFGNKEKYLFLRLKNRLSGRRKSDKK